MTETNSRPVATARRVAEGILEWADVPRVVVARMTAGSPVVDIVT